MMLVLVVNPNEILFKHGNSRNAFEIACDYNHYEVCCLLFKFMKIQSIELGYHIPKLLLNGQIKIANLFFSRGCIITDLKFIQNASRLVQSICIDGLQTYLRILIKTFIPIHFICYEIADYISHWQDFTGSCVL